MMYKYKRHDPREIGESRDRHVPESAWSGKIRVRMSRRGIPRHVAGPIMTGFLMGFSQYRVS